MQQLPKSAKSQNGHHAEARGQSRYPRRHWYRVSQRVGDRTQEEIEELIREIRKILDDGNKRAVRQKAVMEELQKCVTRVKKS